MGDMREIKFRAWDGYSYHFSNNYEDLLDFFSDTEAVDSNRLEQYTGLTDANGKEIYEGDIISYRYGIEAISWVESAAGFSPFAALEFGGDVWENLYIFDDVEIIGNIHENKELLK